MSESQPSYGYDKLFGHRLDKSDADEMLLGENLRLKEINRKLVDENERLADKNRRLRRLLGEEVGGFMDEVITEVENEIKEELGDE